MAIIKSSTTINRDRKTYSTIASTCAAVSGRWSRGDYWETPTELLTVGGDCEDFAIAKYLLLRALGVPASSMRVLMIRGSAGAEGHAVLLVESVSGVVVLDNHCSQIYR